ncbi:MAG: hypothetical protein CLLPBCKN_003186 [Chroococcidiopsis cubana SAG 39.79]|nr:hypothetical protein [Chroococcidiopsis cubana SAG 39.79]
MRISADQTVKKLFSSFTFLCIYLWLNLQCSLTPLALTNAVVEARPFENMF